MGKILIYTANFGEYDKFCPLGNKIKGIKYVYVTDKNSALINGWTLSVVWCDTPRRGARYYKTYPSEVMDHYISVWVDSSFIVRIPDSEIILDLLGDSDMACFRHPTRDCAYEEAEACMSSGNGNKWIIGEQIERYEQEGFPRHYGLWATGIIIRRNTEKIKEFNSVWWNEIKNGSVRDQISQTYSAWKTGVKIKTIEGNVYKNELIKRMGHEKNDRVLGGF